MVSLLDGWSLARHSRTVGPGDGKEGKGTKWSPEDSPRQLASACRVHFVGIGGIGMSGIAEVLLNLGYEVSGSDLVRSEITERLERLGARVSYGHSAERVQAEVDVVVVSSAVRYSNPEVAKARELGIPVIARAEMLAELMRMKFGLAVAGTHGKTTTTSMLGNVLAQAKLDPTIVVGGKLRALGSNARLGQGPFLVAEADESDGSFLMLNPTVAIITNIDREHLDHYGTIGEAERAYLEFANRVPFYGRAVLCVDHPRVRGLIEKMRKRFVTYGFSPDAQVRGTIERIDAGGTSFAVAVAGQVLGGVDIKLAGRHYAQNALAVVAAALELGIPFETVAGALREFEGIHRRFELKGEAGQVAVIDDYAHHPEEIRATLRAAREAYGRRIIAVFQPHRFTRTRDLFEEFLSAFDDADLVIGTEVYPAGEEPIEGVSGACLFGELKRTGRTDVVFQPQKEALARTVLSVVRPADLVITLGAGDVWRVGEEILALLGGGVGS